MKRWMILGALLLLVFAVTACADTTGTTEDIHQSGLYLPDSALEQQTGGAIRVYPLGTGEYQDLLFLGNKLLLVHTGEKLQLKLAGGENLALIRETELSVSGQQSVHWLLVDGEGAVCFDRTAKDVVYLNSELREVSRLEMPEGITGLPQMSPDGSLVYYGTKTGVFALDMRSGIARRIREQYGEHMSVTGVLFEGSVLRCTAKLTDGTKETRLIDATTGESIYTGAVVEGLETCGQSFWLTAQRSAVTEWLTGEGENYRYFWPEQNAHTVFYIPQKNMAVAVVATENGSALDCYTLSDGRRVASVDLPGLEKIRAIREDQNGKLWILAYDRATQADVICRWDAELSQVSDTVSCFAPYYTPEQSNTEALEICRQQANALGEKYGVQIRMWEDAVKVVSGAYTLEAEHLEQAYAQSLPLLDKALSQFPEGFFKTLARRSNSGKLQICLVRSIVGDPNKGAAPNQNSLQFWSGGNAYLILAMKPSAEQDLYHGIMHVIDTTALSVSTAFYEWSRLNPEEFFYDNDYKKNLDRSGTYYLDSEIRAFIDTFSMSFAREDRATVMEYACMPGNAEYFTSPIMQSKLHMLCAGIRQAFHLNKEETFVWEQYLQPIGYDI